LLANYNNAASAANRADGAGTAEVAKVGEGWRAVAFDRSYYNGNDEYHPSPKGSVLAALVLYKTTYHDNTSDISPATVAGLISTEGLTSQDWQQLTALADSL
jgi:hypothetical protein